MFTVLLTEGTDTLSMIINSLKENWRIVAVIAVVFVGSIIANIIRAKRMKSDANKFLKEHPDAAKIFLTTKALITSEAVSVHTVNGENPSMFFENGKSGFYALPGENTVEISYTYTRPGVVHKNVTTTTDVVKQTLEAEAKTSYILGFDRKAETFTFERYEG